MKPRCPHCEMEFDIVSYRMKQHVKYCTAGPNPRKLIVNLSCYFCQLEFHDFAALAVHVRYDCLNNPKREDRIADPGEYSMNVGSYVKPQAERLPLLDAILFKKLAKKGKVTGKMIACRQINSPKFNGLAMDFKNGSSKFCFLARFDRFDVGNLVKQTGSEETDDWIGETITFWANKTKGKNGKKGGTFINVSNKK
jgi:hypothetical protein